VTKPLRAILVVSMTLGVAAMAMAQIKVGQNLSMNLNGAASFGYAGAYGDLLKSSHGIDLGGNASLTGSYYSPNFLNFAVDPYYNQSRANSDSGSLFNASGVQAVVNLFNGSNFPGSIGYSFDWNQEGVFGVPGTPNYTTNGTGQGFSVGWGARVPDWPTLSVSYQRATSDYSVIGLQSNGNNANQNFNLNSAYQWAGFGFSGGFSASSSNGDFPVITEGGAIESFQNGNRSEFFGLSHQLPWYGSVFANYTHTSFDDTFSDFQNSGSASIVSGGVSFHPTERLDIGSSASYNDNLLGTLYQSIVTGGGAVNQLVPGSSSSSLGINSFAGYKLRQNFTLNGNVNYTEQTYLGNSYSSETFTGTGTYWTFIKGGSLSVTGGANASDSSTVRGTAVGAIAAATYSRSFGEWTTSFSGHYNQNMQTALVSYTSSTYGVSANTGRRLTRRTSFNASAGYGRSFLVQTPQYGATAENFSVGLNTRFFGVSANYSKSYGSAFVGTQGLVPTGLIPVNPLDIYFYNSHSYGFGIGTSPIRHLTLSGSYARAFSDTVNGTYFSNNGTQVASARLQYNFRQLDIQAGWSKLVQGFSLSGLPPQMTGSYFIGIHRAFNFF